MRGSGRHWTGLFSVPNPSNAKKGPGQQNSYIAGHECWLGLDFARSYWVWEVSFSMLLFGDALAMLAIYAIPSRMQPFLVQFIAPGVQLHDPICLVLAFR
jgi:hypothetical protein